MGRTLERALVTALALSATAAFIEFAIMRGPVQQILANFEIINRALSAVIGG